MVKNQILDNINKSNASIQFEDRGHQFNNYLDKKRGVGVSGKFTVGHVTKGR